MKPLIIETDIGHDPDDYFALCYLHSAGYDIKAILVSIGHPYQIAITRMFCEQVGLDIPIGIARMETEEKASLYQGFNKSLLSKYGYSSDRCNDLGKDVLKDVLNRYPESEVFVCGPPKNLGAFVKENPDTPIQRITFQGGFIGYHLHDHPVNKLDKFIGKTTVPTYNLGGAKGESLAIIDNKNIKALRFISKNVCHTVIYDKERHQFMKEVPPKNRADELFIEGMDLYLTKHSEKKFHDPTAACCIKHPEIAKWVRGRMYNVKGEWGTIPDESANGETIAAIDYDLLWYYIRSRE